MNVVLFAWCSTTAILLDAIVAATGTPILVVSGSRSCAADPLKQACTRMGFAFECCDDVNADEFVTRIKHLAPDLLFVAGYPHILRQPLLGAFRLGAINLHPSLLPAYRGRDPLFWSIVHGEPTIGVTAHHITEVVDRGPILAVREIPVGPRATHASLAVEADRASASLITELMTMAQTGSLPPGIIQGDEGSYFAPLHPEHGCIDWQQPAESIDRWVRACFGTIPAYTFFEGMKLIVIEGSVIPWQTHDERAGKVVVITEDAVVIACGQGAFAMTRFAFLNRLRQANELAAELGIVPGTCFGE